MKKTLLLAALTALSGIAHAASSTDLATTAESSHGKIRPSTSSSIAFNAGATSFALKSSEFDMSANSGAAVGANYYHVTGVENLDYEVGLQFLQTGGRQTGIDLQTGQQLDRKLTFSYLAVPLGLRYTFKTFEQSYVSSLYVKGGIVPSFLVNSKWSEKTDSGDSERNIEDDINHFDLMGALAFGGTFDVGVDQSVVLELSYMRGTQNVFKDVKNVNEGMVANVMYSVGI